MITTACLLLMQQAAVRGSTVAIDWTRGFGNVPGQTETVKSGDVLTFTWGGGHNVWKFNDKAAFDSCNFGAAAQIPGGATTGVTYTVTATTYFGCQVGSHCTAGQKLEAVVASATSMPTTTPSSAPTSAPNVAATSAPTGANTGTGVGGGGGPGKGDGSGKGDGNGKGRLATNGAYCQTGMTVLATVCVASLHVLLSR